MFSATILVQILITSILDSAVSLLTHVPSPTMVDISTVHQYCAPLYLSLLEVRRHTFPWPVKSEQRYEQMWTVSPALSLLWCRVTSFQRVKLVPVVTPIRKWWCRAPDNVKGTWVGTRKTLCLFEPLRFEFCSVIQLNLIHPVSFSSSSLCTRLPGWPEVTDQITA